MLGMLGILAMRGVSQITEVVAESISQLTFMTPKGRQPITVFATTHNMHLIDAFTHILFLKGGRVVECGKKDDLMKRKGHFYRQVRT